MLNFDSSGLYGDGLLSPEERPSGDDDEILNAARTLQGRFDEGEVGFVHTPDIEIDPIVAWAEERRKEQFTDQLVIGIGGSSLGARAVLHSAMPKHRRGLDTYFAENLDPESVDRLFNFLDPETTLVVVITKSGTTVETMSQFAIARRWLIDAVGEQRANRQIVAVTDPESGSLRKLVDEHGWFDFSIPPNVGGRFSVLTPVGLVPLALAGYPVRALVDGAKRARDRHSDVDAIASSWGVVAAEHLALAERGFDQLVMMSYADRLTGLVDWFRQLWAESLGKATNRRGETVHTGTTPIKAVGVIDQHSQVQLYREGPNDKHITFLEVDQFDRERTIPQSPSMPAALSHLEGQRLSRVFGAELEGTRAALQQAGRPTSTWRFDAINPSTIGAFLYSWQMITALAGELLGINTFDQPGVELGKNIAHGLLGHPDHRQLAQQMLDATEAHTSSEAIQFLGEPDPAVG